MGRIQWREAMSVDRGIIDADHRHLIDIINRFTADVSHGDPDGAGAVGILSALVFYAETHFAREERLQVLIGYPGHRAQHDEHRHLMAALHELIGRTASPPGADPSQVPRDLGRLLRRWLLDHIIKMDLGMAPYAEQIRRQSRGLPDLGAIAVRRHGAPDAPATPPAHLTTVTEEKVPGSM
jgi:hemerythrin